MTQEEKDLVFLELSSRMKYGIKCSYPYGVGKLESITIDGDDIELTFESPDDNYYLLDGRIKPYLRPLSDITKDERLEVEMIFEEWFEKDVCKVDGEGYIEILANYDVSGIEPEFCSDYMDWLDAHYFDHRGLIPRNLALKAPEGMYKNAA